MSADLLRRAATLMRERAQAVEHFTSPWYVGPWDDAPARGLTIGYTTDDPSAGLVAVCADYVPDGGAEHIAGWHPVVALAVADLLDAFAAVYEEHGAFTPRSTTPLARAVALARAYLGEAS